MPMLLPLAFVHVWMCCIAETVYADMLEGLPEDLSKEFPDVADETIGQALLNAVFVAAANENVPMHDISCIRDYSVACPQGWMDVGDGVTCWAPSDYKGACASSLGFGAMSPLEKSLSADTCGTKFPCVGSLPLDLSQNCPESWVEDVDHTCIAPVSYSGPCVGRKSFVDFTAKEKAVWGEQCGVVWPTHQEFRRTREDSLIASENCDIQYNAPCPDQWALVGGLCTAPHDYLGSCALTMASAGYSESQKRALADVCMVSWPCGPKASHG